MTRGRPLRFLALVLGGWVAVRLAVLWPSDAGPGQMQRAAVGAAGKPAAPTTVVAREASVTEAASTGLPGAGRGPVAKVPVATGGTPLQLPAQLGPGLRRGGDQLGGLAIATRSDAAAGDGDPTERQDQIADPQPPTLLPSLPAAKPLTSSSRLHGDLYLIARPTGGDSLAFGQLGASQGGARVTYALGDTRRVALSARISAPLRGVGREAALGVDLRPSRLPVHLLAEARVPLDGGAARPAAQLIVGRVVVLPLHLTLEGYAQAGGVYRRGGFADGATRLTRALIARHGYILDLGAGAWGAAQRRVARVDTGPTLGLTLPAPGRTLRLAVDYRVRVAGRARPGSGPAVSLGSSF